MSMNKQENTPLNRTRPRCTFGKMFGHVRDDCVILEKSEQGECWTGQEQTSCDCGSAPVRKVLRVWCARYDTNCTVCKGKRTISLTAMSAFQRVSADEKLIHQSVRPIFKVQVFRAVRTALLDTGAKQCVVSDSLTRHLWANVKYLIVAKRN